MSPQAADRLPDVAFRKPTEEEADRIDRLFSGENEVASEDFRRLFAYDMPSESIADDVRISAPEMMSNSAVNGNSYASFGDEGTTATVNAYGNLMQISRSLGYGSSGLFSVNTGSIGSPTSSQSRLEQLMRLAKNPEGGIRLEVEPPTEEEASFVREKPKMEFIFNRWPRFTSQSNLNLNEPNPSQHLEENEGIVRRSSVQYFCQKGVVFQKYTFSHNPKSLSALHERNIFIQQDFMIRTLDFVKDSAFNESDMRGEKYAILSGPMNLSYVLAHKLTQSDAEEIGISVEEYQKDEGPKAVALVVTAFVNGKIQTLHPSYSFVSLELSDEARRELKASETVDITIAYRLQLMPNKPGWKQSFVPASSLASMRTILEAKPGVSYQNIRWSSNTHMNFIAGRNLEHILSVCSMPVPKSSSLIDGEVEMDTSSLALTCGDMSGHRVATSATFFAFQFLIESLKYLCDKSKEPRDYLPVPKNCTCKVKAKIVCELCNQIDEYVQGLQIRILKTLEAHLVWTTKAKEAEESDFTHHWITGKVIADLNGPSCSSSSFLMDLSFKIIKSHDLHHFYKTNRELITKLRSLDLKDRDGQHMEIMRDFPQHKTLNDRLGASISSLVQRLYECDERYQYTFSRPQKYPRKGPRKGPRKDEVKKYHLVDHVWICRAIGCVETLGLEKYLKLKDGLQYLGYPHYDENKTGKQAKDPKNGQQEKGRRSDELQRVILKRFTTQNPQSQQRMIATSRTPTESRFLFHAQDTALFYAMDQGFFDRKAKTNSRGAIWADKIAAWKETVGAQAEHEETQTLEWKKPLWYALALIISSKRKSVNKMPADEMVRTTAGILFVLSQSSGIFPGSLNEKREPVPFEDELECDKYWHAPFEIPYALWVYGRVHLEASGHVEKLDAFAGPDGEKSQGKDEGQLRKPMAKKMDFNSSIDKSHLVEISDDWLRDVPSLLNFNRKTAVWNYDKYRILRTRYGWDYGSVVNSSFDQENVATPTPHPRLELMPLAKLKGTVFDVPKSSLTRNVGQPKLDLRTHLQSNTEIKEVLGAERTIQKAKKRLVWLPRADKETARVCYFASARVERDNLSAFFDRHASYEKYFSDNTSASSNEWTTELHLSYFRRAEGNPTKKETMMRNRKMIPDLSFILVDNQRASGTFMKETDGTQILRSVMSFRFVGDFFDRYWTCHFLECDPARLDSEDEYDYLKSTGSLKAEDKEDDKEVKLLRERLSSLGFKFGNSGKKQPWQQRKVLELVLFEYILEEIFSSTEQLLKWVRDIIQEEDSVTKHAAFDMVSILENPFRVRATKPVNPLGDALRAGVQSSLSYGSDGYYSVIQRWRVFEPVLKAIEEDLTGNLEVISCWKNRERDRETEKPRWTQNDEAGYGHIINKLDVLNQRKIRDLEILRVSTRTFRDSLTRQLEIMRSDLEYRGSENTSLFTYVTVVFLPLGFATGILSMSGPPERSTLVSMITLALVSMAITLFALANAKTTGKKIVRPVLESFRSINNLFLDPLVDLLLRMIFLPLKDICLFLCKTLLLLGMMLKFTILFGFHLFVFLPLSHCLDSKENTEEKPSPAEFISETDRSNKKADDSSQTLFQSFQRAFKSLRETPQSIEKKLAEEGSRDPLKLAEERFRKREEEKQSKKKERDIESGRESLAKSENDATESGQRVYPQ